MTLSGGQRQRIAIARALLVDPRILILDDATSSVDTETEHQIQQALKTLMRGGPSFVIAQRLITVKNADQVLVLDHGRIVQHGTHQNCCATPAPTATIYDLQFRDQEEAAAPWRAPRWRRAPADGGRPSNPGAQSAGTGGKTRSWPESLEWA